MESPGSIKASRLPLRKQRSCLSRHGTRVTRHDMENIGAGVAFNQLVDCRPFMRSHGT